jgi:hypothetical protein
MPTPILRESQVVSWFGTMSSKRTKTLVNTRNTSCTLVARSLLKSKRGWRSSHIAEDFKYPSAAEGGFHPLERMVYQVDGSIMEGFGWTGDEGTNPGSGRCQNIRNTPR